VIAHLTFEMAERAAGSAGAAARRLGRAVAVTIVDTGGHVVLQHRHDGVHAAATDVSEAKARAAALFDRPSADLEALVSTADRPGLLALTSVVDRVLAVQGGLPIRNGVGTGSALLGAVGVSGGSSAEDEDIARAAVVSILDSDSRDETGR